MLISIRVIPLSAFFPRINALVNSVVNARITREYALIRGEKVAHCFLFLSARILYWHYCNLLILIYLEYVKNRALILLSRIESIYKGIKYI